MTGRPVTEATDSAAPPRASPSSLVSTTPSKPTPSRNAWAVATASWPIIASTTNRTSSGSTASRMSEACFIISASTPSRPAVSTMTTSCRVRLASSIEARATETGSPTPLPGSGAKTGTPTRSPLTWSWVTALGRCRSAATRSGLLPCSFSQSASFAASVVLPAPWRPASRMTVGAALGVAQPAGLAAEDVDELLVDDLDDLLGRVERPADLLATGPLLDRGHELLDHGQRDVGLEQRDPDLAAVASMSASDSRPLPRRFLKVSARRSERVANTSQPKCEYSWRGGTRRDRGPTSSACRAPDASDSGSRPAWAVHRLLTRPGLRPRPESRAQGECPVTDDEDLPVTRHRRMRRRSGAASSAALTACAAAAPLVAEHPGRGLLEVEHVDRLRPERVDVGRPHGDVELGERLADQVHDARPVGRPHLEHGRLRRRLGADVHRRRPAGRRRRPQPGRRVEPSLDHAVVRLAQGGRRGAAPRPPPRPRPRSRPGTTPGPRGSAPAASRRPRRRRRAGPPGPARSR